MRVVITGATGNVGTSLVERLVDDPQFDEIVGVARRVPEWQPPRTTWHRADVSCDELVPLFRGADAVVHLAWLIQPSRDERVTRATNVTGSRRVFAAAAGAGVRTIVYASSVGTYAPGPKDRAVDETWSTAGVATSFYSRHKAEVEGMLDRFEAEHDGIRVVRLRPSLIFKAEAASEVRRLFLGPFFPSLLAHPALLPVVPRLDRLRFQAVHSKDIAEAYRLALVRDVRGAFNVAADPVLDPDVLAEALHARPVPVPGAALRFGLSAAWRLRIVPADAGWVDMGLQTPLLDTSRAGSELGWSPRWSGVEALHDLLGGLRRGEGFPTPPLAPATGGPARVRELLTGVGARVGLRGRAGRRVGAGSEVERRAA